MHEKKKEVESSSKGDVNAVTGGVSAMRQSESIHKLHADKGASIGSQDVVEDASGQLLRHEFSTMADDASDDLSDIDDAEVIGYLHNKKEMHYKRIIWEVLNREYLEGRQQKRVKKAKNDTPAKKAVKVAGKMDNKERLSSKINYDVLEKLTNEPEDLPKKVGGEGINSNWGNHGDTQQSKKFSTEEHSLGESNYNDEFENENENEYGDEIEPSRSYYGNTYFGNEEDGYSSVQDYDFEDY